MIKCNDWHIGVCTWSLGNDFDKVRTLTDQTQLSHIHFAVSPVLNTSDGQNLLKSIRQESWTVTATMIDFPQEDYTSLESIKATGGIVPDQYWDQNQKRVSDAIDMTSELGVEYLSLHFGFLDPTDTKSAAKLSDRCKMLADKAAEKNILLLMETGQETADELCHFLQQLNHPALAVNFDPANMILYDKGSPIEAVQTLAPWIKHIHIKDALRTQTPGTWGLEVPWGTGQVGGAEFLKALKQIDYEGALAVEREAGDDRLGDIKTAVEVLIDFAG
jgi:sugar phosphate isomerase/epimerase